MDNPANLLMGASVGFTLWNLYKSISKQQPKKDVNQQQQPPNIQKIQEEAKDFKKKLSQKMSKATLNNALTLEQCKLIVYQIFEYSLTDMILLNIQMKKKRMLLKRNSQADWHEYIKAIVQGYQQTRLIKKSSQKEAYEYLKIDKEIFNNYRNQLDVFKKTLATYGLTYIPFIPTLSLDQTRGILTIEINYCKINGGKLIENIIQSAKQWPEQKQRQKIRSLLSVIIIDEALTEKFPEIDQFAIQYAKKLYPEELEGLIKQYYEVCQKILEELTERMKNL